MMIYYIICIGLSGQPDPACYPPEEALAAPPTEAVPLKTNVYLLVALGTWQIVNLLVVLGKF